MDSIFDKCLAANDSPKFLPKWEIQKKRLRELHFVEQQIESLKNWIAHCNSQLVDSFYSDMANDNPDNAELFREWDAHNRKFYIESRFADIGYLFDRMDRLMYLESALANLDISFNRNN